jgi:hypothetical protein
LEPFLWVDKTDGLRHLKCCAKNVNLTLERSLNVVAPIIGCYQPLIGKSTQTQTQTKMTTTQKQQSELNRNLQYENHHPCRTRQRWMLQHPTVRPHRKAAKHQNSKAAK